MERYFVDEKKHVLSRIEQCAKNRWYFISFWLWNELSPKNAANKCKNEINSNGMEYTWCSPNSGKTDGSQNCWKDHKIEETELVVAVVEIRFVLQLELVVLWLNGNEKLISTTRPDDISTIRSPGNSFACMYASATKTTTTTTTTTAAAVAIQAVALAQVTAVQCDFIGFYYTRTTEMPIHHSCGISKFESYFDSFKCIHSCMRAVLFIQRLLIEALMGN